MTSKRIYTKVGILALTLIFWLAFLQAKRPIQVEAVPSNEAPKMTLAHIPESITPTLFIYLPLISQEVYPDPIVSPFGIETHERLIDGSIFLTRTIELGIGWVRLSDRVSWFDLQPEEGGPIQWDLLATFEEELHALRSAGIKPIVVVKYSPRWATLYPTSCGPLREEAFDDFADFMGALVARYKSYQFNVHHWELGNEPDVDPDIVPADYLFGCWGDRDAPYYGGRYYGEMLKVVAPAIRAEDPEAVIWLGGLLLDKPLTTTPGSGRPELFLQGILEAGAADSFDVVAYHFYGLYENMTIDHDNASGGAWDPLDGGVNGKASYLRDLMAQYGVNKPVFLNETSLGCPSYYSWCLSPDESFEQAKANYAVRSLVRGLSENVMGFVWYRLAPWWRYTSLLDRRGNPKPAYLAYQQLNQQLNGSQYLRAADYGEEDIEAYVFRRGAEDVHVVWTKADTEISKVTSEGQNRTIDSWTLLDLDQFAKRSEPKVSTNKIYLPIIFGNLREHIFTISIPTSQFIAAYDREGNPLTPTLVDSEEQLSVGFEPIYVIRTAVR
jgi:hypothetical protein